MCDRLSERAKTLGSFGEASSFASPSIAPQPPSPIIAPYRTTPSSCCQQRDSSRFVYTLLSAVIEYAIRFAPPFISYSIRNVGARGLIRSRVRRLCKQEEKS